MRPRLCWYCAREGVVAVLIERRHVLLRLDGTKIEGRREEARFVCAEHEDLDPWS